MPKASIRILMIAIGVALAHGAEAAEARMSGAASTCQSRAGYLNASRGLVEAAAAPKAGQLFLELEHRQLLCQSAVRALPGRQACEP